MTSVTSPFCTHNPVGHHHSSDAHTNVTTGHEHQSRVPRHPAAPTSACPVSAVIHAPARGRGFSYMKFALRSVAYLHHATPHTVSPDHHTTQQRAPHTQPALAFTRRHTRDRVRLLEICVGQRRVSAPGHLTPSVPPTSHPTQPRPRPLAQPATAFTRRIPRERFRLPYSR